MTKLTNIEKAILEYVYPRFKWIAVDKDGFIKVFEDKPRKCDDDAWLGRGSKLFINRKFSIFPDLFDFINWEDKEPWYIPDLIG